MGAAAVVEAHRRDPRAGPHRRRTRRGRRAGPRADGARARDRRAVRPLLPRHRDRGHPRGRHLGHPRRHQPRRVPAARRPRRAGADHRGGGLLRLPRGGQLDHAERRRGARPRRRLDAAHPGRGPPGARHALVAARRRPHDRALPQPRARQAQAPQGAPRAHRLLARGRAVAGRRRRAGRHRRHGPQPRRRGRAARGPPLLRRPGLPAAQGGARRAGRRAGGPHAGRARRRARHQARARRPDPGRRHRRAVGDGGRRLRLHGGDRGRPARGRVLRVAARRLVPAADRGRPRALRPQPRGPVPRRHGAHRARRRARAVDVGRAGQRRPRRARAAVGRRDAARHRHRRSTTTTTTSTRAT